jgi:hypothetical protein
MEQINFPNFRAFKKAYVVTVREGKGTEDDLARLVHYVFDSESGERIGVIDPVN